MLSYIAEISNNIDHQLMFVFEPQSVDSVRNNCAHRFNIDTWLLRKPESFSRACFKIRLLVNCHKLFDQRIRTEPFELQFLIDACDFSVD